jgi:hypothetical protein
LKIDVPMGVEEPLRKKGTDNIMNFDIRRNNKSCLMCLQSSLGPVRQWMESGDSRWEISCLAHGLMDSTHGRLMAHGSGSLVSCEI